MDEKDILVNKLKDALTRMITFMNDFFKEMDYKPIRQKNKK